MSLEIENLMARAGSEDKRPLSISSALLLLVAAQYKQSTYSEPEASLKQQRTHFHCCECSSFCTVPPGLTPQLCDNPASLWSGMFVDVVWRTKLALTPLGKSCRSGVWHWQQPVTALSRRHWPAQRQEQKILLEKLYSFLTQHIQRYDSSLCPWSHTRITESLYSSSCAGWAWGDGISFRMLNCIRALSLPPARQDVLLHEVQSR